jgi:hypothetical protein
LANNAYRSFREAEPADGILSPAYVYVERYLYQSYFDSTLLEKAILTQSINDQIVASTAQEQQVAGYAVGLHPSSQAPVAITFRQGKTSGASQVFMLKPGQIVKPSGGQFNGIRYGLPFGWLGGGAVQLVVFTSPDAHCDWGETTELIFHRARYAIYQPADIGVTPAAAPFNWPLSFPWAKAQRGSTQINQAGQPAFSVTPTRTAMVLRGFTVLANPAEMAALFQATDDFGQLSDGSVDLTNIVSTSVVWPSWTNVGAGNFASNPPLLMQGDAFARLSANNGGVAFVDASNAGAGGLLLNGFVDCVRYGRL